MSAPVTERGRTAVRGRTAAIPAQRGFADGAVAGAAVAAPARPADPATGAGQSARRSAQQKAYARRDERVRRLAGARAAAPAGRPQFVLLIMVLLAVGLVATLWLSTAAAADSYRLQDATAEARMLSEQAERLKQEVAVLASAPELARRAGELGMVPVRDPARLVVALDGGVEVVGQPRAAVPPPPPAPPADAQPPAADTPEGATQGETGQGGTAPEDGASEDGAPEDGAPEDGAPGSTAPDGTEQLAASDPEEAGAPDVDGGESGREAAGNAGAQNSAQGSAGAGSEARTGGGRTDAG